MPRGIPVLIQFQVPVLLMVPLLRFCASMELAAAVVTSAADADNAVISAAIIGSR